MPINHVTLIEIKADADKQDVDDMSVAVRGLLREVSGVISVEGGRVCEGQSTNWTHIAVTKIAGGEAMDEFKTHAKHDEARALMGPFVQNALALDYEIDEP